MTAGVEHNNSAKLGLVPALLPVGGDSAPKSQLKKNKSVAQVHFNYNNHQKLFSKLRGRKNGKPHQTH